MKKILFAAEAVSLAHVARPSMLAGSLDRDRYEVIFASSGHFSICVANASWENYRLKSISPEVFMRRLAHGRPVYTEAELLAYVDADQKMLAAVQPDAVVGDFRLSLAVSARLLGIPYFAICNAYWSDFAANKYMSAPDLPVAKFIGFSRLDRIFRMVWPLASRIHCLPMNSVRKKYGLEPYKSVRSYYGDGDVVMYSDVAELVPTVNLPDSHHYIGPVTWSPSIDLPPWWSEALGQTRPRAYVTMGSTGTVNLLPAIIDACLAEGLTCLIATAGRGDFISNSPYVFAVEFLPGNLAAANADLVICNGGSPTSYQALQAGVPVFGVCSNLDQVMCMNSIQEAGAGQFIRAGEFTLARARQAMRALLCEPQYRQKSKDVEKKFKLLNPQSIFPRLIERQLT